MSQLKQFLKQLHLEEYFNNFITEGCNTIASISSMSESDMENMNITMEHCKLIRDALNQTPNSRSTPSNFNFVHQQCLKSIPISTTISLPQIPSMVIPNRPMPYFLPLNLASHKRSKSMTTVLDGCNDEYSTESQKRSRENSFDDNLDSSYTEPGKRKYCRRPKPDPNAPPKPKSAYLIFAETMRERIQFNCQSKFQNNNKKFSYLATEIGYQWRSLNPKEKQIYLKHANHQKAIYQAQLKHYQASSSYQEYQEYLKEFYSQGGSTVRPVGRPRKESPISTLL